MLWFFTRSHISPDPIGTLMGTLIHAPIGRVMMGSDFPWYDMTRTVELVRALPDLNDADRSALLGDNAARFFELSGTGFA
jgi:predicted TIM-barrel fold metal-dependent hydrolase